MYDKNNIKHGPDGSGTDDDAVLQSVKVYDDYDSEPEVSINNISFDGRNVTADVVVESLDNESVSLQKVEWGDGNNSTLSNTTATISHSYDSDGQYRGDIR